MNVLANTHITKQKNETINTVMLKINGAIYYELNTNKKDTLSLLNNAYEKGDINNDDLIDCYKCMMNYPFIFTTKYENEKGLIDLIFKYARFQSRVEVEHDSSIYYNIYYKGVTEQKFVDRQVVIRFLNEKYKEINEENL